MNRSADVRRYNSRLDFISKNSVDDFVLSQNPDFSDYLYFHNVIDKFCWLIRLHYGDRETVKGKSYRLDILFQQFLLKNNLKESKACECLSPKISLDSLYYYLSRGWLNELVRNTPLLPDMFEFGTNLKNWSGPGSDGLVVWNVIQSYYAIYEYLSLIVDAVIGLKSTSRGHKAIIKNFDNHVVGKTKDQILFYPFTLQAKTPSSYIPRHPDFCKFQYARYPRETEKNIYDLEQEVQEAFKFIEKEKGPQNPKCSILGLLYELRIWANDIGVSTLMQLSDGGYQTFLMRNLGAVAFFSGGMAELAFISKVGASKYLECLSGFSSHYIDKHEQFARHKYLLPPYIRLRCYKHLGIIDQSIDFILPPSLDPVQFIDPA